MSDLKLFFLIVKVNQMQTLRNKKVMPGVKIHPAKRKKRHLLKIKVVLNSLRKDLKLTICLEKSTKQMI